MSHRSDPGQSGLFELTKRDPGPGVARWTYPCGLCNALEVTEAGGLCEECAPVPFRKPVRRQTSAKTPKPKTAMKTATRPRKPRRATRSALGGGRHG